MSIKEIVVEQQFHVKCQTCDFDSQYQLAGSAENAARTHIEDYHDEHGQQQYWHIVEITAVTLVGRI
jgi:hypothetical protein